MPTTQVVRISWGKGGSIWVSWRGKNGKKRMKRFDWGEMKNALGFAWKIREEERGDPCILLPPNALLSLADSLSDPEWQSGIKKAEEMLAAVA